VKFQVLHFRDLEGTKQNSFSCTEYREGNGEDLAYCLPCLFTVYAAAPHRLQKGTRDLDGQLVRAGKSRCGALCVQQQPTSLSGCLAIRSGFYHDAFTPVATRAGSPPSSESAYPGLQPGRAAAAR